MLAKNKVETLIANYTAQVNDVMYPSINYKINTFQNIHSTPVDEIYWQSTFLAIKELFDHHDGNHAVWTRP